MHFSAGRCNQRYKFNNFYGAADRNYVLDLLSIGVLVFDAIAVQQAILWVQCQIESIASLRIKRNVISHFKWSFEMKVRP